MKKFFLLLILILFHTPIFSDSDKPAIVKKPINVNWKERKKLINEYVKIHYPGIKLKNNIFINPKYIVIHSTATKTFEHAYNIFNKNRLNARPDIIKGGKLNVSTPYLVDRDGKIYQLHNELIMGRHCIGLNHVSIGIENVGVAGKMPLTSKQLNNNIKLVKYLVKKYPSIEYLIAHSEYRQCEKGKWFLEKDDSYRTIKIDPGNLFMKKLRNKLLKQSIKLKNCSN